MFDGNTHDRLQHVVNRYPAVFAVASEAIAIGWRLAIHHLDGVKNLPGTFRPRTRRNEQNDFAVAWCRFLLQPFEESGVLRWVDEDETATFRLGETLAFRMKKTDHAGRPSNISTQRNREILDAGQRLLFSAGPEQLDTLDELTWFTIAYVPDEFDVDLVYRGISVSNGPLLPFVELDDATLAGIAPTAWPAIVDARRRIA